MAKTLINQKKNYFFTIISILKFYHILSLLFHNMQYLKLLIYLKVKSQFQNIIFRLVVNLIKERDMQNVSIKKMKILKLLKWLLYQFQA